MHASAITIRRRRLGTHSLAWVSYSAYIVGRMKTLRERMADVPQIGALAWIGVRPEHDAPIQTLTHARLLEDRGVDGDIIARSGRAGGKRQVTLVQAEHLPVIAALVSRSEVSPLLVRRNLVVSGINLLALVNLRFRIGADVILVGTGPCAPCGKMDEALGPGGFQAMRGHGGITARIERGGLISVGDVVRTASALGKEGTELR